MFDDAINSWFRRKYSDFLTLICAYTPAAAIKLAAAPSLSQCFGFQCSSFRFPMLVSLGQWKDYGGNIDAPHHSTAHFLKQLVHVAS